MDLHQQAEADLAFTLEGDGQTVTVTDPTGRTAPLKAISNDISLIIDPETGVPVSGRNANVALRVASLHAAGFEIPRGIEDGAKMPWLVEYTPVTGGAITTKIMASNPDRALGLVTCRLELVK